MITVLAGAIFLVWIDGSSYGGLLERLALWPPAVRVLYVWARPRTAHPAAHD